MTGDPLGDLVLLVIAAAVYALIRWLQYRYPDPPPRRRRRRKPPPDDEADDA